MAAIGVEMADMWQVAYGCPEILIRGVNQVSEALERSSGSP
jgi:hypothetical protein